MTPTDPLPTALAAPRLPEPRCWLAGLSLFALTVLAYARLIRGGFIWDDDHYILDNTSLRSVQGLLDTWFSPLRSAIPQYYPMTFTTFWIEFHLWGFRPLGFHVVNVLLHAAVAVTLWRLLTQLRVPRSWLAAAIFAVHPVQVESVAWVTELKNVQSGLFYLLALAAYLRYSPPEHQPTARDRRWYFVSLALFALALFSKTVTSSLPAVVLLILYWKRGKIGWKDAIPLVPFFAFGATMGSVTSWMEKHIVGAEGREWQFSLWQRVLIAGHALWFYAAKLAWPRRLCFIYPHWVVDPHNLKLALYPAAAAATVAVLLLMRRRIGRGALVAVIFFAGTLFPALGFVNVFPMRYSFVADHFQYLASIGLIVLAVSAATRLLRYLAPARPYIGATLGAVVLALLVAGTMVRVTAFTSAETLWLDTLATNPDCWMAHDNLGLLYFHRNDFENARTQFVAAANAHPGDLDAGLDIAIVDSVEGMQPEAIRQAQITLNDIPPDVSRIGKAYRPRLWLAIGTAYLRESAAPQAEAAFRNVIADDPNSTDAHIALAELLQNRGDSGGAIQEWQTVTSLDQDYAKAHAMLSRLYAAAGQVDLAAKEYFMAIATDPKIFQQIDKNR